MRTRNVYAEIRLSIKTRDEVARVISRPDVFILDVSSKLAVKTANGKRSRVNTITSITIGVFTECCGSVLTGLGLPVTSFRLRGILDPGWLSILHTINCYNREEISQLFHVEAKEVHSND